jgi:hypothetical protein
VTAHIVYLVGGAPRVGKSVLAQRLLALDGIPWLPTDVIRTVVRRVAPEVDAVDQDPVRQQCEVLRVPYVDVGEAGSEAERVAAARRLLLGRG